MEWGLLVFIAIFIRASTPVLRVKEGCCSWDYVTDRHLISFRGRGSCRRDDCGGRKLFCPLAVERVIEPFSRLRVVN